MERRRRNEFPKEVKKEVKKEQEHRCAICGQAACLEVHHKIPSCHNGGKEKENAVGLCSVCHQYFDNLALHQHRYYDEVLEERGRETVIFEVQQYSLFRRRR